MTWKLEDQAPGYPPIESFLPSTVTVPAFDVGVPMSASDPVWGGGEFIFAKANGTIVLRGLCQLLPVWNSTNRNFDWNATAVPNTTIMGRPVGVCMAESGDAVNALTTGQWGWFMVMGLTPINGTATVAADTAFGITAAGQIGALAAGKQIVNARVVTPATQTVVTASVSGLSGANTIQLANVDGWFVGAYASGTGVGASAIVKAIDRMSNVITLSVVNSAAVSGNVTATYNNATIFYNVALLNRPFAQGAIT